MRQTVSAAAVSFAMFLQPAMSLAQQRAPDAQAQPIPTQPGHARVGEDEHSKLSDVAVIAMIVAASIAIYKSTGKPCACPSDVARNGSSCGGRSAWSKPGGAKPMCFPTDITADMIKAYRATIAIPAVW
jgi:hypothetical protein